MKLAKPFVFAGSLIICNACSPLGDSENYDTGGAYDTSDPYGVPNAAGVETAGYEAVNPPAGGNPTYGEAAYEETAPVAPAYPSTPPPTAATHAVVKGDTLWGLSQKYGVSVDAIRAVNGMAAGDNNIVLGQTLNIPGR